MKKTIIFTLFIFLILFGFLKPVLAESSQSKSEPIYYQQTFDVCYAGCFAWKVYWNQDPIWKYVQDFCTMDTTAAAKTLVKYAFNTVVRQSAEFGPFIQSLYCIGAIRLNLEKKLQACSSTCQNSIWAYSADLGVAGENFGTFYSEDKKKIQIKVFNSGNIYVPTFRVDVYSAFTRDPSCGIGEGDWEKITSYEVPEIAPFEIHRNELNVPREHEKLVDWEPVKNACNKIKIVVDPDNRIPEIDEINGGLGQNNVYTFTVNKLPKPPRYRIKDLFYEFLYDRLDGVNLSFQVENVGEKNGHPEIEIYREYGPKYLYGVKQILIGKKSSQKVTFKLKNLFRPDEPSYHLNRCLVIKVSDGSAEDIQRVCFDLMSGEVNGKVMDQKGLPVAGAKVYIPGLVSTTTDEDGFYSLKGITEIGKLTVFVSSSKYDYQLSKKIEFKRAENVFQGENRLLFYNVDFVFIQKPAALKIKCSVPEFFYRLNGEYFSYQGVSESSQKELKAISPGEYQIIIQRPGCGSYSQNITLEEGKTKQIDCYLYPLLFYQDDSGINFKAALNELWAFDKSSDTESLKSAAISPDGSTIYLALSDYKKQSIRVVILNDQGKKLGQIILPDKKHYDDVYFSPSYSGKYVLIDGYLLLDRSGKIMSRNPKQGFNGRGKLSWDGSFICLYDGLYNSNFEPLYTGAFGGPNQKKHTRCYFNESASFNSMGNIITSCQDKKNALCEVSFWDGSQKVIAALPENESPRRASISADNKKILLTAFNHKKTSDKDKTVFYLNNGSIAWQKPALTEVDEVFLSPQGNYSVILEAHGGDFSVKILDKKGNNLLKDSPNYFDSDFYAVRPTGNGIFYVRYDGKVHFGVFGKKGNAKKQPLSLANSQKSEQNNSQETANQNSQSDKEQKDKAYVSKQTKSWLGKLWQGVKGFFGSIFSWVFSIF